MRHVIHKLICWYLRRCSGAFHCYKYGETGRYVVLMNDDQYHVHQKLSAWAVSSTRLLGRVGDRFSVWRRSPYKRAICAAYSDGVINSKQMHELAERIDAVLPWWRMDKHGWPIETYIGKPVKSAVRIICQNIRKVTG